MQLHQLVETEGVRKTVDRVELAGDKDALQNLVIAQTLGSQRVDILIRDLVGMLRQLDAETQERFVLLLDRQSFDIAVFGCLRRFFAAPYEPQEK